MIVLIQYLAVGKILTSWGTKGQIKVEPLTDDIKRFEDLKSVYIEENDNKVLYNIESVLFLKNTYVVLKLEGIDTIEEADKLRDKFLKIDRKDAVELADNHFFICDIIGLDVYSEEKRLLGKVTSVLETKANDVYVVKSLNDREILIPAIKEVVRKVDLENNAIIVRLMEGMI